MAVSKQENGNAVEIGLTGTVDIGCAAELKKVLVESLRPGAEIRIALNEPVEIDITGLQLLCAAAKAAEQQEAQLVYPEALPEEIKRSLELAGLPETLFPVAPANSSPNAAAPAQKTAEVRS